MYFVANDSSKLSKHFSMNLNVVLFHSFSLNICEYLKYKEHPCHQNQQKNYARIHIF